VWGFGEGNGGGGKRGEVLWGGGGAVGAEAVGGELLECEELRERGGVSSGTWIGGWEDRVPCFWFRGRLPTLWARSGLIPGRVELAITGRSF